jgi:GT2 family glycosyltransferase
VRYRLVDLDVDQPIADLALAADESGAAILARHRGRPVAFVLHAANAAGGGTIAASTIEALIAREARSVLVAHAMRREIAVGEPAPAAAATLTIAVCTHDRPEWLARSLRSILAVRDAASAGDAVHVAEVLVVDNAPADDRARAVCSDAPNVRYVREDRVGLDFARNRALHAATGDFVAFIDDDAVLDVGWLAGLAGALSSHPDAGAFTGLVLPYELETDAQITFERHGGFRRGCLRVRYAGPDRVDNPWYPVGAGIFGAGCNMVLRRSLAVLLGGFDEALDTGAPLPGGGDLDIFHRIVRSGAPLVYEPAMLVFHAHRRERSALRRQYYGWGLGFMAYMAKTWHADPTQRRKILGMARWWTVDLTRELVRAIAGLGARTPALIAAELAGGIVGATGAYARSQERSHRIRQTTHVARRPVPASQDRA